MSAIKNELITRIERIEFISAEIALHTNQAIGGDIDAIRALGDLSRSFAMEIAMLNVLTIGA